MFNNVLNFNSAIVFVPSRALPQLFATWWGAAAQAIGWVLKDPSADVPFRYGPNSLFELRFVNPFETVVMNPIPTFDKWKEEFDTKYHPGAFVILFPPDASQRDDLT